MTETYSPNNITDAAFDDDLDLDLEMDEDVVNDDAVPAGDERFEHWRLVADKGQQLLRVDKFIINLIHDVSRNRVQQAADAGAIYANGRPVKSNYRVKPGDVITLMLDRPKHETVIEAEDIPLNIVYEDDAVLVVNKPAGLVVHPGCGNYHGTLVNALAWHLRDCPGYDPNDPTVGLVHRIDKDTSGLLVVAKTADAKTKLCSQFFHKTTRRRYHALVWGHVQDETGRIEGNIGRDPKDRLRMAVFPPDSEIGKPAVTHYRVIERLGYVTLVECILETGRTHQIRAHMRHIGHPLFGDERYGGDQVLWGTRSSTYNAFVRNCQTLCPRQALHALTLGFCHPVTAEEMDFNSEYAPDFAALIDKWRAYVAAMK